MGNPSIELPMLALDEAKYKSIEILKSIALVNSSVSKVAIGGNNFRTESVHDTKSTHSECMNGSLVTT